MYRCCSCEKQFKEPEIKREVHDELDGSYCEEFEVSFCCKDDYTEISPCEICGECPSNEYGDELLNDHGGLCEDCFMDSVKEYFMEYLSTLDYDDQLEFYCGDLSHGYVYSKINVRDILGEAYTEYLGNEYTYLHREWEIWKQFIEDNDPQHFAEFAIKLKNKKEGTP